MTVQHEAPGQLVRSDQIVALPAQDGTEDSLHPGVAGHVGTRGPVYSFVYWEHAEDNIPKVLKEVAPRCGALALELMGGSDEKRQQWQQLCNDALSARKTRAERREATRKLGVEGAGLGLWAELLRALPPHNQPVFLVDRSDDHPDSVVHEARLRTQQAAAAGFGRFAPNAELEELVLEEAHTLVTDLKSRDFITSTQLLEAGKSLRLSDDVDFVVMYGAGHTDVESKVADSGAVTRHVFVGVGVDRAGAGSKQPRFHNDHELLRFIQSFPEREVSKSLLRRIIIERTMWGLNYYWPRGQFDITPYEDHLMLRAAQEKFTDRLSDQDIGTLYQALDDAKRVHKTGDRWVDAQSILDVPRRVKVVLNDALLRQGQGDVVIPVH